MRTLINLLPILLISFSFLNSNAQQVKFYNGEFGVIFQPSTGFYTYDGDGLFYSYPNNPVGTHSTILPVFHPPCDGSTATWVANVPQKVTDGKDQYRLKLFKSHYFRYKGFNQNNLHFVGESSATTRFWDLRVDNIPFERNYIYVGVVLHRNKGAFGWSIWREYKTTKTVFIGDCGYACDTNHVIPIPFGNGTDHLIEATNSIRGENIISSGANVRYDAGVYINLVPGFHAKVGSNFTAYIDGCGGRSMRTLNPDTEIVDEDKVVEDEVKSEVKIYPNPSLNGKVTIDLTDMTKSHLQIYSLNGRIVKEMFGEGKIAIDLSHLKKGIYLVKITSQEETIYKRIMLN